MNQENQEFRNKLRTKQNPHIETSRNDDDGFQTTNHCVVCGEKNFISDFADDVAEKANWNWFKNSHKACGENFASAALIEAKAKVAEILKSERVSAVEVVLEEDLGDVRNYTAITRETSVPHRYTVRVEDSFELGEKITTGKCVCAGFQKYNRCKHVARVADIDAEKLGREIYPFELMKYRAHKTYRKLAA